MRREELPAAVQRYLCRLPAPYGAHYGVVLPAPPREAIPLGDKSALISAADRAIGKAEALQANFPGAHSLDGILRRQEATASCMVEGIECDLEDLLTIEETQDGSASGAARQVRDYALALDQWIPVAQDRGHAVFTQDLISALHRQVMRDDDAYKDTPGRLRDRVVWIGGGASIAYSTFNPPPPAQVPKCLGEVIDYMQCDGMQVMTQGLLTWMAVAHAMFEAVHPFRDGNGRVGRLLLPLMMAAEGTVPLYLSPYIEAHKGAYHDALKAAQQRLEWDPIVGFMADAVVGTVAELLATRTALADLAQIWQTRRPFRQGSASLRALGLLPHYPVLTVNRLAEALDVSFKSAAGAMEQLAEAGIVTERTGYARNRIFVATEALVVINRPFGAEPYLPTANLGA